MDGPLRAMDFAIVAHLGDAPPSADLLTFAARRARRRYPITQATLTGKHWTPVDDDAPVWDGSPEDLLSAPFNPAQAPPVRQVVEGDVLATRFHHAACDGRSAIQWLDYQLRVVGDLERPDADGGSWAPPQLRHHPRPRRKQRHAHRGPSARLSRTGPGRTGERRWKTWSLDRCTTIDLAEAAITAAARWNQAHGANFERVALWFPMDIRAPKDTGFGNGSSRVRLYRAAGALTRQLRAAFSDGEWSVAAAEGLTTLPRGLVAALLRCMSWAPWLDMGTLPFTHLEGLDELPSLGQVRLVEAVGVLDTRHPLGVIAASHRDTTSITLTWDAGELDGGDAEDWFELMREALTWRSR